MFGPRGLNVYGYALGSPSVSPPAGSRDTGGYSVQVALFPGRHITMRRSPGHHRVHLLAGRREQPAGDSAEVPPDRDARDHEGEREVEQQEDPEARPQ